MNMISPIIPVSDLRHQTKDILVQVQEEPVVLTQRGRAVAIVIEFEAYQNLIRRVQELEDLRDEAAMLLAQANLEHLNFADSSALTTLYREKLDEPMLA